MSQLTTFRDHCRKMAGARHKPECPTQHTWRPNWDYVALHKDDPRLCDDPEDGLYAWLPNPPKPACEGCNPAGDQALFAQMAGEVDAYLDAGLMTCSEPRCISDAGHAGGHVLADTTPPPPPRYDPLPNPVIYQREA